MAKITTSINDQLMVTAAHRYCIDRSTYIVSSCIAWLDQHWDQLDDQTKKTVIRDTERAIEQDRAGMEMDKREWVDFVKRHNVK